MCFYTSLAFKGLGLNVPDELRPVELSTPRKALRMHDISKGISSFINTTAGVLLIPKGMINSVASTSVLYWHDLFSKFSKKKIVVIYNLQFPQAKLKFDISTLLWSLWSQTVPKVKRFYASMAFALMNEGIPNEVLFGGGGICRPV